jgi:hypothetical protein
MGNAFNYSDKITKNVLSDDGQYRTKNLIRKNYDPGHPGYCGGNCDYYCKYCRETHNIVACPYKWYYTESTINNK